MATMNGSSRPATDVAGVFDSALGDSGFRREASRPDPEVLARAKRRQFTGEYKQRILTQTDAAKGFGEIGDRKSTRLNSSHLGISYAVFCLKNNIIANPHPWAAAERSAHHSLLCLKSF